MGVMGSGWGSGVAGGQRAWWVSVRDGRKTSLALGTHLLWHGQAPQGAVPSSQPLTFRSSRRWCGCTFWIKWGEQKEAGLPTGSQEEDLGVKWLLSLLKFASAIATVN